MNTQNRLEEEEIELLLPWYEKETLSAEDMRRVETYLAAHPESRVGLALIREEAVETIAANERIAAPGLDVRTRLMQRIAAEEGNSPLARLRRLGWLSYVLPGGLSPGLAVAAIAAAIIILVQATLIVSLLPGGKTENDYRVASGGEAALQPSGTFALVRFSEAANAGQITQLLSDIGATIADGPKAGGAFKIRLSPNALNDSERDALLERLRSESGVVVFAAPTG